MIKTDQKKGRSLKLSLEIRKTSNSYYEIIIKNQKNNNHLYKEKIQGKAKLLKKLESILDTEWHKVILP